LNLLRILRKIEENGDFSSRLSYLRRIKNTTLSAIFGIIFVEIMVI
jgi:hypothetical protein